MKFEFTEEEVKLLRQLIISAPISGPVGVMGKALAQINTLLEKLEEKNESVPVETEE